MSVASAVARGGHSILREVQPVLDFPEPGLDDTASYQGYKTRFFRDSRNNTVQIYIQPQTARVVLVWADAANESAGFSVRDAAGRPARVTWGAETSAVSDSGNTRSIEYQLTADVSRIQLGWFVLGSMRVERDFVYSKRYQAPFTAPAFRVAEESLLVADVGRLPADERKRHLEILSADDVAALRVRLEPSFTTSSSDSGTVVRIVRPSLDDGNNMALELRVDPRKARLRLSGRTLSIATRPGNRAQVRVRITTDAAPLTPLARNQIFNPTFMQFLEQARTDTSPDARTRYRRLERQVLGVELLSSQEKLMAGLPNFATYFGRDMMMTALMMRPIWTPDMSEHVIASVLRKLGPGGQVSHEEALGGQAIREHAVIYDSLLVQYRRAARPGRRAEADTILMQARDVLGELQKTRENYHMIDDEFQLPVLIASYLTDSAVPSARKRAFLLEQSEAGTRVSLLLRELALVANLAAPYAKAPEATNLVSFPKRDATHWRSASWRDSDAGYAGGRFAMDINAIWVPQALESISSILRSLAELGISAPTIDSIAEGTPLADYAREPATLRRAIGTWKGARRHFEVNLTATDVQKHIARKLAWLPPEERRYWRQFTKRLPSESSISFLALSLDSAGTPIPVVNTDPATGLFLEDSIDTEVVQRSVRPFVLPFPMGLLIPGVGAVVANDVYASKAIWDRFRADTYHGPRVVWGREINLFLIGAAKRILAGRGKSGELREALRLTLEAVNASGLQHNELWSYVVSGGVLRPIRYGTSSDVQLWNTTNLVVQFVLSSLPELQ